MTKTTNFAARLIDVEFGGNRRAFIAHMASLGCEVQEMTLAQWIHRGTLPARVHVFMLMGDAAYDPRDYGFA